MAEPFVLHINPTSSANPAAAASFIRSIADQQFLLQIGPSASSTPLSFRDEQTKSPPSMPLHGTLNLKVTDDPILLHINSLTPFLSNQPISTQSATPPPPPPPLVPSNSLSQNESTQSNKGTKHQKALSNAGSLANLLPTGTVLAFQAITPSLSYNGRCHVFIKYLVALVMLACSLVCILSSFTDSVEVDKKVYYGIATFKGLSVFNYEDREVEEPKLAEKLKKLKIKKSTDFVHAFVSVFVFLIFACSSLEVQSCYFPAGIRDQMEYSMVIFFPLIAGVLAIFLFTIYPTKRRGIGYTCARK